jgi:hypothetical protein
MYAALDRRINMSGLSARLNRAVPALLTLPNAFQSAAASAGTEALARRTALLQEVFVAAGPVATTSEKNAG